MSQLFEIKLSLEDIQTIWDALYGRRSQSTRAGESQDSEKIQKYDRLMKLFDTDVYMGRVSISK